jgi:hypothetical protein
MKPGIHMWMLKRKSSQSSGSTHTHTSDKSKMSRCQKLIAAVYWDRKVVLMVEFMQQRTTVTSHSILRNTKNSVGPLRTKAWNADIRCSAPLWQCAAAYICTHSNTAKAVELRVVLPLPLQSWSAASDYHLFTPTYRKNWLSSQRFKNNELMEGVKTWQLTGGRFL